jgi:hypothetical protein
MNEDTAYILLWMLMAVCLGLMVGMALGDEVRRRKNAEQRIDDLLEQRNNSEAPNQGRQLKEIRSILNDAHKQICAVTKALVKPTL